MSKTTDGDRIEGLERDVERLKRAVAALVSGVDWSTQRGGRDRDAMRAVCDEVEAARQAAARPLREAALEAELAELKGAA